MQRLAILAAFLLVVSLLPVTAQRGGVRGGFGGHGTGMAHSIGAHGMGHPFGGHSFGGFPRGTGFFFGGGTFNGVRFHGRGFHHCWWCRSGFGFPWYAGYGWGYWPPFWGWDSSSSYNQDEERDREVLLANQINLLNMREQDLREREEALREREQQQSYVRPPQPPAQEQAATTQPTTVLVFRDQHRQEISNYAISGGTLWVLSDHLATKKIPLADLDLVTTAKANDERGVQFQVPK